MCEERRWVELQSILCTSTKLRKVNLCQFSYVFLSKFSFSRSHLESYINISLVILTHCKLKFFCSDPEATLLPLSFLDIYIAGLVARELVAIFSWRCVFYNTRKTLVGILLYVGMSSRKFTASQAPHVGLTPPPWDSD